jgi:hypothetical protein
VRMLSDLSLFFFVLLGSKVVLGAVAVYMLLPHDARCVLCDAEMLPLEHPRGTHRMLRLLRLQRRWCIECRTECLTRRAALPLEGRRQRFPVAQSRVR